MSSKISIMEPDKCVKSLVNFLALEQWGRMLLWPPQGTSGFMEILCSSGDLLEKEQPLESEP